MDSNVHKFGRQHSISHTSYANIQQITLVQSHNLYEISPVIIFLLIVLSSTTPDKRMKGQNCQHSRPKA